MTKIPLTQGKYAIVDDADFDWLSQHKWCYTHGYAQSEIDGKKAYMHRLIMGGCKGDGTVTDHINGDRLDNRRSNLRTTTMVGNGCNRGKNKNNSTGFKGVYLIKRPEYKLKRWEAYININRRRISIGRYPTREEAAKAYNEAALKHHGEFARLNPV